MFRNYKLKNLNFRLIILVMVLTIIGIAVIGSIDPDYQKKQILGMVIGLVAMTVVALLDYSFVLSFSWVFYVLTIILLGLVFVIGESSGGATRWITIGIRFQPSEIAKVLLILFFARYLMQYQEDINKFKRLIITVVLMGIPLLLIVREPDLSTTIVTFMILFTMLFYTGLSYKVVGSLLGLGAFGAFVVIFSTLHSTEGPLAGYQNARIASWLQPDKYPDTARQQQNSIMAIGSGQIFGKGLSSAGAESIKSGSYVYAPHTDFIFAVTAEDLGFVGSAIVVILLTAIAIECIRTAKKAKDMAGKLICIGMASLIGYQSFVNICVVTGLMPNTGLTLPFVSYGLTSLVTLYIGIGFVLNVSLQAKKFYEV